MNPEDVKRIIHQELMNQQYGIGPVQFHTHNGLDSPKLNAPNDFIVSATTKGTTGVNIFTPGGGLFNMTITGYFLISNDTNAANITVKNNGATVATIAKGTTAGAMVGATSLSNTTYSRGTPLTVSSSSVSGNSTIFLTFTT